MAAHGNGRQDSGYFGRGTDAQVAVLDVAPYRHCVPSHTYRPRFSVPQTLPATLVGTLTAVMLAFLR